MSENDNRKGKVHSMVDEFYNIKDKYHNMMDHHYNMMVKFCNKMPSTTWWTRTTT
jgi:hypothetical protein